MHKSVLRTLLVMFLVPLAGAVAIHAQPQQKKQRPSEPQTEERLAREVRHQLILLPYYSVFDNLEFSVKNDVVTLAGQVVRPTLKSDAEATVKSIEGVAQVVNNIEVLPRPCFRVDSCEAAECSRSLRFAVRPLIG